MSVTSTNQIDQGIDESACSEVKNPDKQANDSNTGDNNAITMFMQAIDPKAQLKALYVDDIAVEEISASQKLVNANTNQGIGGYAQTSAGNGNVKAGEEVMFYAIPDEGLTFKGWYKNRILRCLLVFLTSTIGSMLGSLVAFPMIIARL